VIVSENFLLYENNLKAVSRWRVRNDTCLFTIRSSICSSITGHYDIFYLMSGTEYELAVSLWVF